MKKSLLTAVVLAKNAESTIQQCLASLSFCDELMVIDDDSDDKTAAVAKKMGATVYQRSLKGNFAAQRSFAMEKATHTWILFVDADEVLSESLRNEIEEAINSNEYAAYRLRRRDFWWGKELRYGETMKVRNNGLLRLMKKKRGHWVGTVHEEYVTEQPTTRLNSFINHYPHPTLREFIHEVNVYSTLRAMELYDAGARISIWQILAYPTGKFLVTYGIKGGFLDGPPGFAYAFLMSFHSYLVRVKLYQYRTFGKP